jgi:uncharacterized protein YcfJ
MNRKLAAALGATTLLVSLQAAAQISFYEGENFRGHVFTANGQVSDFDRVGFNDRASSVIVQSGRWLVCEDAGYSGNCAVLRPGNYESLSGMGLNNRISSVRPANGRHASYSEPAPVATPVYEYRRRPNERIYDAPVTSVRAVVGSSPEQRCWVEREHVNEPNVGGAVVGAIIGGVLGHQVGSGRGNDVATGLGAVAGGAIGANHNRGGERDVQHCENISSATPAYYDVTYNFNNVEHRVQLSTPPGPTIAVNSRGEPRG